MTPPDNGDSLLIENCHHVELMSRLLNHMPGLRNITINNSNNVVLHPKVGEQ